jgi:hypothetical protein
VARRVPTVTLSPFGQAAKINDPAICEPNPKANHLWELGACRVIRRSGLEVFVTIVSAIHCCVLLQYCTDCAQTIVSEHRGDNNLVGVDLQV